MRLQGVGLVLRFYTVSLIYLAVSDMVAGIKPPIAPVAILPLGSCVMQRLRAQGATNKPCTSGVIIMQEALILTKSEIKVPEPVELRALESYKTICGMLARNTRGIPVDLLARHILLVTDGFDWPVQCAATEAMLRRIKSAASEGLQVAVQPRNRNPFGLYHTRRSGSSRRPYATVIFSVDPIHAECGCPDFVRNSLGFCKHVAIALLSAIQTAEKRKRQVPPHDRPSPTGLQWHPIRPGVEDSERLSHIHWVEDELQTRRSPRLRARLSNWFTPPNTLGLRQIKNFFAATPQKRHELLEQLSQLLKLCNDKAGAPLHPAIGQLIGDEMKRVSPVVWHKHPRTASLLSGLKRPLYPYQEQTIDTFLRSGRLLVADDMGLGKTTQAIACCLALWKARRISRGLLVVPAPLKSQWEREWGVCANIPIEVVTGNPTDRADAYRRMKRGFLIVNYEQVLRDLTTIQEWDPQVIVLDEAQRIKNWETKIARHIKSLHPPYRLMLTGTPMENRLEEIGSLMDWIDDQALEPKWRLVPWHSMYDDGKKHVVGARHLEHLRERLKYSMIRRVRQEVLDQLPPRTDTVVPVEMTTEQIEYHDSFRQPIAQLMNTARRRPLTQAEFLRLMSMLTKQRIVSDSFELTNFEEYWEDLKQIATPSPEMIQRLSSPKLTILRDLVTSIVIEQRRKVVVFSQWTRMLKLCQWAIAEVLSTNGLRSVFFTGEESLDRRTNNVVDFHDDPSCAVMFLSDAGSVGLNLQRAASACINLDLPWNPAVLEQRIGRIYRIGQTEPIDVYNLVSDYGIEGRICAILDSKQALFSGLFDGMSDTVRYEQEGGMLKQLQQLLGDEGNIAELKGTSGAIEDEVEIEDDSLFGVTKDVREEVDGGAPTPVGHAPLRDGDEAGISEAQAKQGRTSQPSEPISSLFRDVAIHRTPEGGVTISASRESAATLVSVFEGMAALFRRCE
jgi:hypothetical protein